MNKQTSHPQNPGTPIMVHKTGAEGVIEIDNVTGVITTPLADRPEWADSLYVASFGERNAYWQSKLGVDNLPSDISAPEVYNFQDLEWYGADVNGIQTTQSADLEYRMDKLSEIVGMDLTDHELAGLDTATIAKYEHNRMIAEPTDEITLREAEEAAASGDVEQITANEERKVVSG